MSGFEKLLNTGIAAASEGSNVLHNEQPEPSKGLLLNATEACYSSGELPLEAAHVRGQGTCCKYVNAAAFSNSVRGWLRCPCHHGTCDVRQLLFADYEATVRSATPAINTEPRQKLIYVFDILRLFIDILP
ncbi:hypothetical protein HPB48_011882 [Haemaphysalis longicornis]|uniref:Uncharacterized protein n=1 Tax=Haemaphysalis longicornis TaxID=44386 RepID=A0A9J6FA67_HAELO|nr:hypothetical protein HPB48_011882 [Haemaphysalis longicornis]